MDRQHDDQIDDQEVTTSESSFRTTLRTLRPALYLTTNNIISTIGLIACMNMLAQLGDDDLAASALISSSEMVIIGIATGALRAIGTLVGESYGALNRNKPQKASLIEPLISPIENQIQESPSASQFSVGERKSTMNRSFNINQQVLLPTSPSTGAGSLVFPKIKDETNEPEEEIHEINAVYQQGVLLSLSTSLPIVAVAWFIDPILQQFGQSQNLTTIVEQYFHGAILSIPLMGWRMSCQMVIFGMNQHPLAVTTTLMGTLLQAGLAYLLIFGKWGFNAYGAKGLGYAVSLAECFNTIMYNTYFACARPFRSLHLFSPRICSAKATFSVLWKQGWPMLIRITAELLSIFVTTAFVGRIGSNELGAQQIASQYVFMLAIPFNALSQGVSILISQMMGGKQFNKTRNIGFIGMGVGAALGFISLAISLVIPDQMASFYFSDQTNNQQEILNILHVLLPISMTGQVFDGIQNVASGALYGIEDSQAPMLSLITALWVIKIPLALILGFMTPLKVNGVALSHTLALGLNSLFLTHRWNRKSASIIALQKNFDHSLPPISACLNSLFCRKNLNSDSNPSEDFKDKEIPKHCFSRLLKRVFG
jgi:multidrug resistance protein, MATE family